MTPATGQINSFKNRQLFRAPLRIILLLTILWVLSGLLVNPAGEFPLNDSWSYAKPVKTLYEEGRVQMSAWTAMPLIAHVAWGWLVSTVFGL